MSRVIARRSDSSGRRKASRGSAMVELALIGTMLFVLLTGIADLGQYLFLQQAIVERARAAARWGAVTDPTNSVAIQNMVLYLQPTAPVNGKASYGLTPAMVTASTADAGTDHYRLVLQISGYSLVLLSPYLAGTYKPAPISISVPLGLYY